MAANGVQQSIPIVDFTPLTASSDPEARKQVAHDLAEKLSINGCIGIRGHGVSPELLQHAFDTAKRLFDLPYEDKMKAPHPDAAVPHRGYSGIGREQAGAKGALDTEDQVKKAELTQTQDYKESYEIGSEENKLNYNIWLPEDVFPGFREFTLKFFWELNKLANIILDTLITSLNLTEHEAQTVKALHRGHENQLRLLHYPPFPAKGTTSDNLSRLGAHTDWSLFTLLFQDGNQGLEFRDRKSSSYVPAKPLDGVLYLNVGDMFDRISNGIYPSAFHRVSIPGDKSVPRYSIPYFVAPVGDAAIEPQPTLIKAKGKQMYEPVTFNSYSEMMFSATNKF